MDEWITIYDENHEKTGRALRSQAHREGLWHEVIHCWLTCPMGDQQWMYFQQRSEKKEEFPGYYDIGSGGHVREGESHEETVIREVYEELGISVEKERLHYLGMVKEAADEGGFLKREFAHVYLYQMDLPAFFLGTEVEQIVAIRSDEFLKGEQSDDPEWTISAMDLYGEPLHIRKSKFCSHPGEFEKLVLPRL